MTLIPRRWLDDRPRWPRLLASRILIGLTEWDWAICQQTLFPSSMVTQRTHSIVSTTRFRFGFKTGDSERYQKRIGMKHCFVYLRANQPENYMRWNLRWMDEPRPTLSHDSANRSGAIFSIARQTCLRTTFDMMEGDVQMLWSCHLPNTSTQIRPGRYFFFNTWHWLFTNHLPVSPV